MIEQLQRELACTVDALSRSSQEGVHSPQGGQGGQGQGQRGGDASSYNSDLGSTRASEPAPQRYDAPPPSARNPGYAQAPPPPAASTTRAMEYSYPSTSRPALPAVANAPVYANTGEEYSHMHTNQTGYSTAEDPTLMAENERLACIVQDLEATIDKLKNAWRESDTKLHFRTQQVGSYAICYMLCSVCMLI
jgi:hypothetical protein